MSLQFAEKTPDFKTPIGQDLENLAIAFIVIQTIVMCLYYTSRWIHTKEISGVEMTFFMPLGYISTVGNSIVTILFIEMGGMGHHINQIDYPTFVTLMKLFKASEMIYIASVMFPKLAILSLFIRLFMDPTRKLSYATGAIVVAAFIAGVFVWAFECDPFEFSWNKLIPGGTCLDQSKSYAYFSIPNLISDVAIMVLPIHPLWKLQVPRSTKIGLIATFVLGGVGIITSIVRLVKFCTINIQADPTFNGTQTMRWTIVEAAMYQIAATIPTLRPLLQRSLTFVGQVAGTSLSRLQRTEEGQQSGSNKFVKLAEDGYGNKTIGSQTMRKKDYQGVWKTTDVSISSTKRMPMDDEYELRMNIQ